MHSQEREDMRYSSQDAFEAGVKTRETVGRVAEGAKKTKKGIGGLIGGGIENITEGYRDSADAVADSTAIVAKTAFQNRNFFRGLCAAVGFLVTGVGMWHVIPWVGSGFAGGFTGLASGKPVQSSNGLVVFSSSLGAGVHQTGGALFGSIGQAGQSFYQYQEVQNRNSLPNSNPGFVGGNIRAGGINPYPQPVVPIQSQPTQPQQPYQPIAIGAQPYNPNVYQPYQRR
jgi:hypothetical protein